MKLLLQLCLGALWSIPAFAGPTAQQMCDRIDSLYHTSTTWQVAFEQKVHYPVFDETETESGKLGVGPKGKFRLITDRYVIVSDGDTLWTHNLRANQVTIDLVEQAGETVRPADFLFRFKEEYKKELCEEAGPGSCVHMISADETAFIREMWLWTDPKNFMVKRALYKDINLNETTFEFKSVDFKYKPGAAEFRYEAPPGVEVVRMPRAD